MKIIFIIIGCILLVIMVYILRKIYLNKKESNFEPVNYYPPDTICSR